MSRVVAIVAVAAGLATLPSAAHADGDYGVTPRKVVVNQDYELINWRVNDSTGCWTDADASLEHVKTREQADYDFAEGGLSGTFKFYDWNRYGNYQVVGTAWDDCSGDSVAIASTRLKIKAAAKVSLDAVREGTGPWVTLHAQTKRYDGGYPLWKANRGATVRFERKVDGRWRQVAQSTANSAGWAVAQFRHRARASYRAVVGERTTVWSRTSRVVAK